MRQPYTAAGYCSPEAYVQQLADRSRTHAVWVEIDSDSEGGRSDMTKRFSWFFVLVASMAAFLISAAIHPVLAAQAPAAAALTGEVRSNEEGPMEGVLVSAKK